MGIFDYVMLSEELRERLGRYGAEDFQTKYVVERGSIRVYHVLETRRRLWRLLTWNELLVEPKPSHLVMEPLMRTVKLEDIGVARLIEASTTLSTHLYNVEEAEARLRRLGFRGPEVSEEKELEFVYEVLGGIRLENNRAELELIRGKDEGSVLGPRMLLRVRSGSTELSLDPNAVLRISGYRVEAEVKKPVFRKILVKTWSKETSVKGVKAPLNVRISREAIAAEGALSIEGSLRVSSELVREDLIDDLVKLTENIAEEVLLKH